MTEASLGKAVLINTENFILESKQSGNHCHQVNPIIDKRRMLSKTKTCQNSDKKNAKRQQIPGREHSQYKTTSQPQKSFLMLVSIRSFVSKKKMLKRSRKTEQKKQMRKVFHRSIASDGNCRAENEYTLNEHII